jgi:anti-sigma regulatory factor (Ser/Thr protein kinase)
VDERKGRVDEAMAEQAHRTTRFADSIGTSGEFSAYAQLRSAGKRLSECAGDPPNAEQDRGTARFCFSLAAEPEAAGDGRDEVSRRLDGLIDDTEMEIALLLLSEAVTNAYVHGRATPEGTIGVEGHLDAHMLWMGVTNLGPSFECSPTLPAATAPHGRGLFLVSSLSRAWGIANACGSTSVWFELDHEGAGTCFAVP